MKTQVTIRQVAERAGVSKSTITNYLQGRFRSMSPATRARVAKAIRELEYQPNLHAQALRNPHANLVGLVLQNDFHRSRSVLMREIQEQLAVKNYRLLTFFSDFSFEREKEILEELIALKAVGAISENNSMRKTDYMFAADRLDLLLMNQPLDQPLFPETFHCHHQSYRQLLRFLTRYCYDRLVLLGVHRNSWTLKEKMQLQELCRQGNIECAEFYFAEQGSSLPDRFARNQKRRKKTCYMCCSERSLLPIMYQIQQHQLDLAKQVGLIVLVEAESFKGSMPGLAVIRQNSKQLAAAVVGHFSVQNAAPLPYGYFHKTFPSILAEGKTL